MADNKPTGLGVVLNSYGGPQYIGTFKKGKLNGYVLGFDCCPGTETGQINLGIVVEGEFKDNRRDGKCKYYTSSGYADENSFFYPYSVAGNEIWISFMSIDYEGEYKDGKRDGKGIRYWDNIYIDSKYLPGNQLIMYEGEFKQDQYHGKGTQYNADGTVYWSGKFSYGKPKK